MEEAYHTLVPLVIISRHREAGMLPISWEMARRVGLGETMAMVLELSQGKWRRGDVVCRGGCVALVVFFRLPMPCYWWCNTAVNLSSLCCATNPTGLARGCWHCQPGTQDSKKMEKRKSV